MKLLKRISRVIFSRTTITLVLLALQVLLFYLSYVVFREYILYFYGGYIILSLVVVIFILNNKQNPAFKIAWIIPILALPIFGTFMYLWVRLQLIPKKLNRKLLQLKLESARFLSNDVLLKDKNASSEIQNFGYYLYQENLFPTYTNVDVKYFPSGEEFFPDLLEQLKKAKKFIFLEFFIIERGIMWNSILDILKEKVQEGVEVRVLFDGTCSITLLPKNYSSELQQFGIQCKEFSPLKPFISTYQNNRDHRKIVVIDGIISYTGGVNLADEYINEKVRFGYWKDVAIRIEGDATNRFTMMFLEMWNIDRNHFESFEKYLGKSSISRKGYVIPYGDNPFDQETLAKNVFLNMIHSAEHYIHIMTPYLILDNELVTALCLTAKKGIDTSIIMPHIPDKMYAYLLARTYYEELLEAGVKIYEFTPGFVHAKVLVSDDIRAVVGSTNFDYRSLYLNFECGCCLYEHKSIPAIEKDFQNTLKSSHRISLGDCYQFKLTYKIIGKCLRLFAPLM